MRRTRPSLMTSIRTKMQAPAATIRMSMICGSVSGPAAGTRSALRIGAGGVRLDRPDVLERAEPELLLVVEARVVHAAHVVVAMLVGESVVGIGRLPAVDHEIAGRRLDVPQELRADI